jgi:hypothetical protein
VCNIFVDFIFRLWKMQSQEDQSMIETKKQAIQAVNEIQKITGWKYGRIAKMAGVHRATINRLMSGANDAPEPNEDTRRGLYLVQIAARAMG